MTPKEHIIAEWDKLELKLKEHGKPMSKALIDFKARQIRICDINEMDILPQQKAILLIDEGIKMVQDLQPKFKNGGVLPSNKGTVKFKKP